MLQYSLDGLEANLRHPKSLRTTSKLTDLDSGQAYVPYDNGLKSTMLINPWINQTIEIVSLSQVKRHLVGSRTRAQLLVLFNRLMTMT